MQYPDAREALRTVFERVQAKALASHLGITAPAITGWKRRGYPPARHVLAIERLTGVSRHALRPDLYPNGSEP